MNAYRIRRVCLASAVLVALMAIGGFAQGFAQTGGESGSLAVIEPPPYYVYLPCIQKNTCVPIFFDNFSNPASGWPVGVNYPVTRSYVNGEYLVQIDEYGWFALTSPGVKAVDYRAAVTVRNATELPYSYYGLLFGANGDLTHFYSLEITSYGNYGIYRYYTEGNELMWEDITPGGGWSEYINQGASPNRLIVERVGNTIKIYANGQLLDTAVDATYTGSLYIGLISDNFYGGSLLTYYDDFGVYPLSCQLAEIGSISSTPEDFTQALDVTEVMPATRQFDFISKKLGKEKGPPVH